jgi:hypothetical protein
LERQCRTAAKVAKPANQQAPVTIAARFESTNTTENAATIFASGRSAKPCFFRAGPIAAMPNDGITQEIKT